MVPEYVDYTEMLKKVYDPNAERIERTGTIENDDLEIYEVPAGHAFYLEEAELNIQLGQVATSEYCYLYWESAAGEYIRDLCQIFWFVKVAATMGKVGDHAIFPSGLLIPEGDVIWLVSPAAGYEAEGNIFGHLVVGDA